MALVMDSGPRPAGMTKAFAARRKRKSSLLGWRHRVDRGVGGRRRLVEVLDLGACAHLLDQRRLRAMRDIIVDLALDLLERRRRLDALVLDLDDVPPELGLHRVGNLSLAELERDRGEFRDHLLLGEIAEIAAVGPAWILGLFLRQCGE